MSTLELLQRGGRLAAGAWLVHSRRTAVGAVVLINLAALALLMFTEIDWVGRTVFVLTWGALNGFWLAVLRRPALAAALSLLPLTLVMLLSMFKYSVLWMTLNFFDVLIIDPDTVAFLLAILPDLGARLIVAAMLGVPLAIVLWRIDPFRIRRSAAVLSCGGLCCRNRHDRHARAGRTVRSIPWRQSCFLVRSIRSLGGLQHCHLRLDEVRRLVVGRAAFCHADHLRAATKAAAYHHGTR